MSNKSVREIALKLLNQVGESGGFSHILINQAINNNNLSNQDKGLLTEIVYGTLQRKLTLEYYVKHLLIRRRIHGLNGYFICQFIKWHF